MTIRRTLAIATLVVANHVSAAPAVSAIPASQWGGVAAAGETTPAKHRIERITLHHGGVLIDPATTTESYLQSLQAWSRREKGWSDLPYHYLIDKQGRVFEGRDINVPGDTNTGYNPSGHALIVVLGNFEEEQPNDAQLKAIVDTMATLAIRYDLPVNTIASHRDYSSLTACPGKNLTFYLQSGWIYDHVRERVAELRTSSKR